MSFALLDGAIGPRWCCSLAQMVGINDNLVGTNGKHKMSLVRSSG